MLTQQNVIDMLLSGRVVQANMAKANLESEATDCQPSLWGKTICLSHKLQGLLFSLKIGDYISAAAIAAYNGVSGLVSGQYGVPTLDPNAQGGSVIVNVIANPASPIEREYTEVDLIDAGGGNFYLPFIDSLTGQPFVGKIPLLILSNNIEVHFDYNNSTNPARLYGFANNDAQLIKLTVI